MSGRFLNEERLLGHGRRALRRDALTIAAAGLAAADPAAALRRLVRVRGHELTVLGAPHIGLLPPTERPAAGGPDGSADGGDGAWATPADGRSAGDALSIDLFERRLFLVGAGKASIGMAAVLDELLGPCFVDAAVVVKEGQSALLPHPLEYVEVVEAAHPVPDERSLAGGLRLLDVAKQVRPGDLVLGLVTGGSSALAVAPAAGVSLDDLIVTNRVLLASGAGIEAMNDVRKHLSRIKGGRLAAACGADHGACQIVNFTVGDVVGDPLDYVTDLTVPDRSTWAMAQEACDRYGLWDELPPAAVERLRRADPTEETPKELPGVFTWVVADAARMCEAAAEEARRLGYAPRLLGLDWEGEARDAGRRLAGLVAEAPPGTCLVAGGENTVTLTAGDGQTAGDGTSSPATVVEGSGGPSQEAALAAALELGSTDGGEGGLRSEGPAVVLCLDSDGADGPTPAAGALVDDLTRQSHPRADLAAALDGHRSAGALTEAGDVVVTGPTGTNVNDFKLALRPR